MTMQHLKAINDTRWSSVAQRAICAIENMVERGERISFYSVAKEAQIARSTLYRRDDLRALVEMARMGEKNPLMDDFGFPAQVKKLEGEICCSCFPIISCAMKRLFPPSRQMTS